MLLEANPGSKEFTALVPFDRHRHPGSWGSRGGVRSAGEWLTVTNRAQGQQVPSGRPQTAQCEGQWGGQARTGSVTGSLSGPS